MDNDDRRSRWIDSHAHLAMFDSDEMSEVIRRAASRGVAMVLAPATGPDDFDVTVSLAEEHPEVVAAVGIHPHDATSLDAASKRRISRSLDRDGVVAVGEIGLDFHYMNSPREDQLSAFEWQLDLAIERELPVVVHNRESFVELEPILAARANRLTGVCHSFTEGPDEARRVVALGLVIGISGMVTFKTAENIREMARSLSPDEVMVETDSPFLAPVPHRGKRNEPAHVVHVGGRLAAEWSLEPERVAEATTEVFCNLFKISPGGPIAED